MSVKAIEIGFENCEVMRIESKYIHFLEMNKIKTKIMRSALNCIGKEQIVNKFAIGIAKEYNTKPYLPFGEDRWSVSPFERLQEGDITNITIIYDDASPEEIYWVDFVEKDSSGCYNLNQKSLISEKGNLYITICEGMDVKDLIDIENEDGFLESFGEVLC